MNLLSTRGVELGLTCIVGLDAGWSVTSVPVVEPAVHAAFVFGDDGLANVLEQTLFEQQAGFLLHENTAPGS